MKLPLVSPIPPPDQELLLKSCLFNDDLLKKAFYAWKNLVNFETDIYHHSFRQLPLLYFNLSKNGIDDPLMLRLKGIYRKSWSKNQLLFHKAAKIIKLLQDNEIPVIVIKGIALSILVYKNVAVRPMADIDILVPVSKAEAAFGLLNQSHWISIDPANDDYYLKNGKSLTMTDEDDTELDLHWYPFFECFDLMNENDFWDQAVPVVISGVKTLALCPADELLLTVVHGLMPNVEPPIRWIPDSMVILTSTDLTIDWTRFLDYAKKFHVVIQIIEGLKYLKETFNAPIPTHIYSEILQLKPSLTDKMVYKYGKRQGVFVYHPSHEKLAFLYTDFLKHHPTKNIFHRYVGFLKYMRNRIKGKPVFRIMIYYLSFFIKQNSRKWSGKLIAK